MLRGALERPEDVRKVVAELQGRFHPVEDPPVDWLALAVVGAGRSTAGALQDSEIMSLVKGLP